MFDLDQSIQDWCTQVLGSAPHAEQQRDELSDHLYCMVEQLQSQGHSAQSAFTRAREMLGEPDTLSREFAKNHSWKQSLCNVLNEHMRQLHPEEIKMKENYVRVTIINSLLWAAAMIATSLLLRGTEAARDVFMLLLVLSTVSVLSLQQVMYKSVKESACSEWRWMMRQVKRLRRV